MGRALLLRRWAPAGGRPLVRVWVLRPGSGAPPAPAVEAPPAPLRGWGGSRPARPARAAPLPRLAAAPGGPRRWGVPGGLPQALSARPAAVASPPVSGTAAPAKALLGAQAEAAAGPWGLPAAFRCARASPLRGLELPSPRSLPARSALF